ncbi:carbohydrate esterase family 15 protein [Canariomyces notabilis]|uniref:(4-O-methyl)-D-glucuronate--lignin esterase n=1 Tax=Canariomyces notabilis TaxID=2074819 RepID=A0AAN6THS9_9PEZI|nr:carbohydrate esterase family 15 protein [Canariomyces arenarius]
MMKWSSTLASLLPLTASWSLAEPCAPVPPDFSLTPAQPRGTRELPDPFVNVEGNRISKKSEWACRRSELAQLAQTYELGPIPGPPTSLDASVVNNNQLIITIRVDSKTTNFTANITYPTTGTRPYPGFIVIGGSPSIPIPANVARVNLPLDSLANFASSSRNIGRFFDLYGASHGAGTTAVGVWAVSRVIDAVSLAAKTGAVAIDPARLGVTGCSRNGRAALAAGGFDERVALTVVQETGAGADSCYRLRDDDKPRYDVCNSVECPGTDQGQARVFLDRFMNNPSGLPFDRHSVAALVAPRALLVLQDDLTFNQPRSSFQCMGATKKVYEALGVSERMAVSLRGGHELCKFPKEQQGLLDAYIGKFLLGEGGDVGETDVVEMNSSWLKPGDIRPAYSWRAPKLE